MQNVNVFKYYIHIPWHDWKASIFFINRLDTVRKLKVYNTFRRRPRRLTCNFFSKEDFRSGVFLWILLNFSEQLSRNTSVGQLQTQKLSVTFYGQLCWSASWNIHPNIFSFSQFFDIAGLKSCVFQAWCFRAIKKNYGQKVFRLLSHIAT